MLVRKRPVVLLSTGAVAAAVALSSMTAAQAAPVPPKLAEATAFAINLNASVGTPPLTVVRAAARLASVDAPPNSSATVASIAARLGTTVAVAADGVATASATSSAAQNRGTSAVNGLVAAVLGLPITATTLSGTATCPIGGPPTAATVVQTLSVFGTTITAVPNGAAVNVVVKLTGPLLGLSLNASVRTSIEQTTATTADATALLITLTLTGSLGPVTVNVPVGTIVAGEASCRVPPAPTATGLTPPSGPTAGGTRVTVTGTGFVPGQTTVTIGGNTVPASAVTVTSPTTLTFLTPPHAAGPVQATVTTPAGTSGPLPYRYVPPPTATGLTPPQGPSTGGTHVTVTGTGFVPGQTTVTIGGITIPASGVTVTSPTTLTFVTPPHAVGPVTVTVQTPGGTAGPLPYTYVPVPTATGLDPDHGGTAGGTTVVVTGSGFVPGNTFVTIGGVVVPASQVNVTSPTSLSFVTPAHDAGAVDVVVTTPFGSSGPLTYTYLAELANTGSPALPLTGTGLGLLLAGFGFTLLGRRRPALG